MYLSSAWPMDFFPISGQLTGRVTWRKKEGSFMLRLPGQNDLYTYSTPPSPTKKVCPFDLCKAGSSKNFPSRVMSYSTHIHATGIEKSDHSGIRIGEIQVVDIRVTKNLGISLQVHS